MIDLSTVCSYKTVKSCINLIFISHDVILFSEISKNSEVFGKGLLPREKYNNCNILGLG